MDRHSLQQIGMFSNGYLIGGRSVSSFEPTQAISATAECCAKASSPDAATQVVVEPKAKGKAPTKPNGAARTSPSSTRTGAAAPTLVGTGVDIIGGLQKSSFVDIGANMLDPMFRGEYRGKQKHEDDLDAVLKRATAGGVNWMMVTAGNLQESQDGINFCASNRSLAGLACTVGVHPTRCSEFEAATDGPDAYMQSLFDLARSAIVAAKDEGSLAPVVAVGEFGLDYDRLEFCPKETQTKFFELQLQQLAKPLGLPLFLHCRTSEAARDLHTILTRNKDCYPSQNPGVVHSFDGALEDAQLLIELGFRIGINGCSLRTAENLEVVRQLPAGSILLETDAPWCNIRATHAGFASVKSTWDEVKKPEKWEIGKCVKDRTEPCHIAQVFEVVAGARGLSGADAASFARSVYEDSMCIFFPGR